MLVGAWAFARVDRKRQALLVGDVFGLRVTRQSEIDFFQSHGETRRGKARQGRQGVVRRGMARQARQGEAKQDKVGLGRAGVAKLGGSG